MFSCAALLLLLTTAHANMNIGGWNGVLRTRRSSEQHLIEDCMTVASEAGHYFYKASSDDSTVCGVYIMAEPDRLVEVYFDYLDVPCNTGGLIAFVDGWELNRRYFPSVEQGGRPLSERVTEFCGLVRPKKVFLSSQNAALIQYRIPNRGRGFSFTVSFVKNPTPCNVLVEGSAEIFTLRNYGKASNCSLVALFPVRMSILSLGVGIALPNTNIQLETGTLHKCQEKGISDYLQIGGGEDLGLSDMLVLDTVCGVDSMPGRVVETLMCGVSTVRLVSSGSYENSVTVSFRQATEEDIPSATFVCPLTD